MIASWKNNYTKLVSFQKYKIPIQKNDIALFSYDA